MGFDENLSEFRGMPVVDWSDDAKIDFNTKAVRLRVDYDEADEGVTIPAKLASLLDAPGIDRLRSLVIGSWQSTDPGLDAGEIIEAIVSARPKFSGLRDLFFGDIMQEECEVSWIQQGDYSPLLAAYDQLEHLTVRGGEGLTFGSPQHAKLRELVVQCGGLPPSVIHEIASAKFPNLEHLELYLGEPNYGGDATVDDLAPLLRGDLFPKLKYLGLKDSVIEDEIAGVAALAPVVNQLEVLDLSLGSLSDAGARALLGSPAIRTLKKLDLHHHYISPPLVAEFKKLGINVDLSDPQEADDWGGGDLHRYIAVSE